MSIVETKEKLTDINLSDAENTYLYVARKEHAGGTGIDWKHKIRINWTKYEIKETDMRIKTATFTSPDYFDLTTGIYCILIVSKLHENFGGEILKVSHDKDTGLYEYQCQDFSRDYQSKFDLICANVKTHRVLKNLLTRGLLPLKGSISQANKKKYKKLLSGLRPAYQYEQKFWGSATNFNPMTVVNQLIIRDKSYIEAIRDLVYGSGAYIDVYFDMYGVCHIEPYTKKGFFNSGLRITTPELANYKYNADITNIVTGVMVYNSDETKLGDFYGSNTSIKLDLSVFFGDNINSMSNPEKQDKSKASNPKAINPKKATNSKKTSNPYNTKKKIAYINSDRINTTSSDYKFMREVAKLLQKNGWKTKIIGLGPNTHTELYMNGCKNGVWLCIYGGSDPAVFKEAGGNNSYTNKLKRLHSRTVFCMHGGADIREGGKAYKWLGRAHDDNYSPSSFRGLSYPIKYLTKHKVPICYGSNAKKLVAKFLAGGDNPKAD